MHREKDTGIAEDFHKFNDFFGEWCVLNDRNVCHFVRISNLYFIKMQSLPGTTIRYRTTTTYREGDK